MTDGGAFFLLLLCLPFVPGPLLSLVERVVSLTRHSPDCVLSCCRGGSGSTIPLHPSVCVKGCVSMCEYHVGTWLKQVRLTLSHRHPAWYVGSTTHNVCEGEVSRRSKLYLRVAEFYKTRSAGRAVAMTRWRAGPHIRFLLCIAVFSGHNCLDEEARLRF